MRYIFYALVSVADPLSVWFNDVCYSLELFQSRPFILCNVVPLMLDVIA